jgi:hypothetical protein
MHLEFKAQLLRIERDRSVDIVDNVPNLHRSHRVFSSPDHSFLIVSPRPAAWCTYCGTLRANCQGC